LICIGETGNTQKTIGYINKLLKESSMFEVFALFLIFGLPFGLFFTICLSNIVDKHFEYKKWNNGSCKCGLKLNYHRDDHKCHKHYKCKNGHKVELNHMLIEQSEQESGY
jgi:hypothetical protein